MIAGIVKEEAGCATVCRVVSLSDELKAEIRKRLAEICHGKDKVTEKSVVASYKETLKIFLRIYDGKSEDTRKGMIGELLTHILLLKAFPNYESANPYFNMEEASIKKGFDLIVFDKTCDEMRIVEVKSGGAGGKRSDGANRALLNVAKNDLKDRLNDSNTQIWMNAINGAKLALSGGKIKDEINKILERCYSEATSETADSRSKMVVLVSVLYNSCSDPVSIESVQDKAQKVIDEKLFRQTAVFSIQKGTWEEIVAFLQSEAAT